MNKIKLSNNFGRTATLGFSNNVDKGRTSLLTYQQQTPHVKGQLWNNAGAVTVSAG